MPTCPAMSIFFFFLLRTQVETELGSHRFGAAMEILRRHRVNLNLMADSDPGRFMEHIGEFVHQGRKDCRSSGWMRKDSSITFVGIQVFLHSQD